MAVADAYPNFSICGIDVTQVEQRPEVLPTAYPALGAKVHDQLAQHGADVLTGTTVREVSRAAPRHATTEQGLEDH